MGTNTYCIRCRNYDGIDISQPFRCSNKHVKPCISAVTMQCLVHRTVHYMKGLHKNLRTSSANSNSPLQKVYSHYNTLIVSCILNSTDVWFRPPQCGLYSFRAQNKVERLGHVDPGITKGVTDLYPSRGYTRPVTRAIEVSHAACKTLSFYNKTFMLGLKAEVHSCHLYIYICIVYRAIFLRLCCFRLLGVFPFPASRISHIYINDDLYP